MTPAISPHTGKSSVLDTLGPLLRNARIPQGATVSHKEWISSPENFLERIFALGIEGSLAVRSDRSDEDEHPTNAGRYLTLLDVFPAATPLLAAIERVFASYDSVRPEDRVFVQAQVSAIRHAMVASTTGAFGSEYDSVSIAAGAAPDSITRGDAPADTWHFSAEAESVRLPRPIARVASLLRELRTLVVDGPFEIEIVDDGSELWLLQLRPLPGRVCVPVRKVAFDRAVAQVEQARNQGAVLFGMMPDWNTAELLGAHPRPMALSLFESLIGDSVWWRGRADLGYAPPYCNQLVRPVAGRPYVDVRASFESLCPADATKRQRAFLVQAWLEHLQSHPHLHDRVEFDVVQAGFEFDMDARMKAVGCSKISNSLISSLGKITIRSLAREQMESEVKALCTQISMPRCKSLPLLDRWNLLRECVAIPFSRMARRDFLARSLWESLVRIGVIEPGRYLHMLSDAPERPGLLESNASRAARPGQFDIRSSGLERFSALPADTPCRNPFVLSPGESSDLSRLLREHRLPWSPQQLVALSRMAARGREFGKWVLASILGDLLAEIRALGAARHLDAELLSWLRWPAVVDGLEGDPNRLREASVLARQEYQRDSKLKMPLLFAHPAELEFVRIPSTNGHYLGRGKAAGPLVCLTAESHKGALPSNAIVAIRSADPGYEWIFEHQPAALITAFGGPHSHMALRCADAGCGAILGIGPERFERLVHGIWVSIDFEEARLDSRSAGVRRGDRRVA
ncbi:PEP-utilizing enzyme [Dokdonella immobilis]|uniref:PEP-utilising enzyme, mobile domain n=1 Tax=Dokdonella immobilis TaxID=578942 RepID=A0A1I4V665_9GAMM|nr:PEP-utilizing enzyme [Dokdonella immobilis]SFM96689.1 PEP-utilising enzyme, mobile domain [Dokdonella immobilis]